MLGELWRPRLLYISYLRPNFSAAPSSLKLTLHKTLVRPKLEYACAIWDTTQTTLTQTLEAIQNRAARLFIELLTSFQCHVCEESP